MNAGSWWGSPQAICSASPSKAARKRTCAHAFRTACHDISARGGYPDDDDLAQSIIVAEAAEEGPLDVEDLGHRFWEWGELNGLGMGNLTS